MRDKYGLVADGPHIELWLASERCQPGEVYNVGGSQTFTVQGVIERIQSLCERSFEVATDPALVRPYDEPVIWGDTTRFAQAAGWAPEFDVADTVQQMLDWWRSRLATKVEAVHE